MTSGRRSTSPIVLQNVAVGYGAAPVLSGLNWTIEAGSMTALVGPNGSGKSTILKAIAGEIRPLTGRIAGNDRDRIGYLPQTTGFDRDFPITVQDVVAMGLWRRLGPFARIGHGPTGTLANAIAKVGLKGLERRSIGTLSGGQLQRALFARLMLLDAEIVLLDEPFAAIDEASVETLMELVRAWHLEGRTIIAALHDLDRVRASFPLTMRIEGDLARTGATHEVLSERRPAGPAPAKFAAIAG